MANEITVTTSIVATKDGVTVSGAKSHSITIQSTLGVLMHNEQIVGNSKESLATADVSTSDEVVLWLRNMDASHIVSVWAVSQQPPSFYMRPGETLGPVRVYGGQISGWSLQSSATTSKVEVILCEAGDPNS